MLRSRLAIISIGFTYRHSTACYSEARLSPSSDVQHCKPPTRNRKIKNIFAFDLNQMVENASIAMDLFRALDVYSCAASREKCWKYGDLPYLLLPARLAGGAINNESSQEPTKREKVVINFPPPQCRKMSRKNARISFDSELSRVINKPSPWLGSGGKDGKY